MPGSAGRVPVGLQSRASLTGFRSTHARVSRPGTGGAPFEGIARFGQSLASPPCRSRAASGHPWPPACSRLPSTGPHPVPGLRL